MIFRLIQVEEKRTLPKRLPACLSWFDQPSMARAVFFLANQKEFLETLKKSRRVNSVVRRKEINLPSDQMQKSD